MINNTPPTLFDVPDVHLPVLPYGVTSGWSGSSTSKERAERDDKTGTTSERQRQVVRYLASQGTRGATWQDLAHRFGWHHGTASGALSVLHKAGVIARLAETRDRCKVYVHPLHVDDRTTEQHRPNVSTRLLIDMIDELEADLLAGNISTAIARLRATRSTYNTTPDNKETTE